jgi:hypothetical protein
MRREFYCRLAGDEDEGGFALRVIDGVGLAESAGKRRIALCGLSS